MMLAKAVVFILWITVGSQPPYQRGEYPSYSRCVEAAQGANLGSHASFDCVAQQSDEQDTNILPEEDEDHEEDDE